MLISAGERDPICPASESRRLIAYLEAQHAEVTQSWHPGGHEIAPSEGAAVTEFLAQLPK